MLFVCAAPRAYSPDYVEGEKLVLKEEVSRLKQELAAALVPRPASAPSLDLAELEAFHRWSRGERFCCSTGIDDGPTYGYGNLDGNGFWEFPLPPEFVERLHAASAPSRPLEELIAEMRDRANYDFNMTQRAKELILSWIERLRVLVPGGDPQEPR